MLIIVVIVVESHVIAITVISFARGNFALRQADAFIPTTMVDAFRGSNESLFILCHLLDEVELADALSDTC